MKIRSRLILSFTAIILILVLYSLYGQYIGNRIAIGNQSVDYINELIDSINKLESYEWQYTNSNNRLHSQKTFETLSNIQQQLITLENQSLMTHDFDLIHSRLSDYRILFTKYITIVDQYSAIQSATRTSFENLSMLLEDVYNEFQTLTNTEASAFVSSLIEMVNAEQQFSIIDEELNNKLFQSSLNKMLNLGNKLKNSDSEFKVRLIGQRISVAASEHLSNIEKSSTIEATRLNSEKLLSDQSLKLSMRLKEIYTDQKIVNTALSSKISSGYLIILAIVVISSIIVTVTVSNSISKSLHILIHVTNSISQGNYSERVPIHKENEFKHLSNSINKMARSLNDSTLSLINYSNNLEKMVSEKTEELQNEKDKLEIQATTDSLTGLKNRGYIIAMLKQLTRSSIRYNTQFSLAMLDIDHFKLINDTYGHQVGDIVLEAVSSVILNSMRDSDEAGRYGGEEFLLLFPNTDVDSAYLAVSRIYKKIDELVFIQTDLKVTLSAGVAQSSGEIESVLLRKVDDLMYKAKDAGRNRIEQ